MDCLGVFFTSFRGLRLWTLVLWTFITARCDICYCTTFNLQRGRFWLTCNKKEIQCCIWCLVSVCEQDTSSKSAFKKKYSLIHTCIYSCIKLWISVQLLSAIFNIWSLSSMSPRILYLFLSYYCELLWFSDLMVRDVYVSGLKVL